MISVELPFFSFKKQLTVWENGTGKGLFKASPRDPHESIRMSNKFTRLNNISKLLGEKFGDRDFSVVVDVEEDLGFMVYDFGLGMER